MSQTVSSFNFIPKDLFKVIDNFNSSIECHRANMNCISGRILNAHFGWPRVITDEIPHPETSITVAVVETSCSLTTNHLCSCYCA